MQKSSTKEFLKLLAGVFVSQSGSHFLTLTISSFVFVATGSVVQSSLVFVATFLPAVFFSSILGNFADRQVSRLVLCSTELLSILTTIFCGCALYYHFPLWVLCLSLALRSILMLFGRSLISKWLKIISPAELQPLRFKFYSLSFFLSTACAGILAGVLLKKTGIPTIVAIDVFSYLLSISIYLTLKPVPHEENGLISTKYISVFDSLKEIFKIPKLSNAFMFVVVSQSIFQGAYSALVSYLPVKQFKIGLAGVGNFQIAASMGIIAGFVLLWLRPNSLTSKNWKLPAKSFLIFALGLLVMFIAVSTKNQMNSLIAFGLMNFAYEAIWLYHSSDFFRSSPKAHAARFNLLLSSCAALTMSLSTMLYALAIQKFELPYAILPIISIPILMGAFKLVNESSSFGEQVDEKA